MLERSTLTQRFQTTIPAAVRKALDLKPGEKIAYEIRENGVLLRPAERLTDLAGSLQSKAKPLAKQQERETARQKRLRRNR